MNDLTLEELELLTNWFYVVDSEWSSNDADKALLLKIQQAIKDLEFERDHPKLDF